MVAQPVAAPRRMSQTQVENLSDDFIGCRVGMGIGNRWYIPARLLTGHSARPDRGSESAACILVELSARNPSSAKGFGDVAQRLGEFENAQTLAGGAAPERNINHHGRFLLGCTPPI